MKEKFKERLMLLMKGDKPYTWARKVGIEKGLFQYYWQKGKIPSYNNLIKIKNFTGCSLDWLLTGKAVAIDALEKQRPKDGAIVKGEAIVGVKKAGSVDAVKQVYAMKNINKIELMEDILDMLVPGKKIRKASAK